MAIVTGSWRDPRPTKRDISEFETWRANFRPETVKFEPTETRNAHNFGGRAAEEFKARLRAALTDPNAIVTIEFPDTLAELFTDIRCEFADLSFYGNPGITLHGLSIQNLSVPDSTRIERCRIGTLRPSSICDLSGVWLSRLYLSDTQVFRRLTWRRGYFGTVQVNPSTQKGNPFGGDIRLEGIHFNTEKDVYGVQWLRDMRVRLLEKNNIAAAAVFHAAELQLNERDLTLYPWIVSKTYRWMSNYGNSIGRPLFCFAACVVLASVAGLALGTTATVETNQGWQIALQDGDSAKYLRAAVYGLQSVFNPLSLFVSKPLITSTHWAGALMGSVFGLLGIASIALFLLSVRRRFKLE